MKKQSLSILAFIGLLSTSFSSCANKEDVKEEEKEDIVDNEEKEDEIVEEEIIDIDKEEDDQVKDEGEIAGSQEVESVSYKYSASTNLHDVIYNLSEFYTLSVNSTLNLSSVSAQLTKKEYDNNNNLTNTRTISINSSSITYYLNGNRISSGYKFKVTDIGEATISLSFTYDNQSFSDSVDVTIYFDDDSASEENKLSFASLPRTKFLVNSSIDFSNLRVAYETKYIGVGQDITTTKLLDSNSYGLLVDNLKYDSSKTYSTSGTHQAKVFYYENEEIDLATISNSNLSTYVNNLEDDLKLSFNFQVSNENEIHDLVVDIDNVVNRSYSSGDVLDLSLVNVNYYTEKKKTNNSTSNYKSVKTLFSDEFKFLQNNKTVSSYTFDSVGTTKFGVEVTSSSLERLTSSFSVSTAYDNASIINNYDDNDDTLNLTIKKDNANSSISSLGLSQDKGYFSPDEIETTFGLHDFVYRTYACPSTGKVPLVIVPVVFPDSDRAIGVSSYTNKNYASYATSSYWDAIYRAFFGKEGDGDLDSLRSFYYKSSYQQLNLSGLVTDYCYVDSDLNDLDSNILTNMKNGVSFSRASLSQSISKWVSSNYDISSKYDTNNDDVLDGLVFVWIGPRTNSITAYWDAANVGTIDSKGKDAVTYLWTSALNTIPYTSSGDYSKTKFRSAILTHEFGHLIGAYDLYPSTNTYFAYKKDQDPQLVEVSSSSSAQYKYAPLGYYDQMDHDVGDHNLYNKMLYGWIKPYIVYGKNVTLDLKSNQHKDTAVIIYDDEKVFSKTSNNKISFSPFDEYLLVDYYTNKNLNKDRVVVQYSISPLQGYGGRIYHVDSRLKNKTDYINDCSQLVKNNKNYRRVNKNTYSSDNSYYEELRWIQSTGFKVTKSISKSYTNFALSPSSFFLASGNGLNNEFSITGKANSYNQYYHQSFVNGKESKMNNGKINTAKITFNSLVYF